jgi:hypothetical protein
MIKIADERLNKVSHLTVEETATLLRLLQGDWEFVVRPTMQDCNPWNRKHDLHGV